MGRKKTHDKYKPRKRNKRAKQQKLIHKRKRESVDTAPPVSSDVEEDSDAIFDRLVESVVRDPNPKTYLKPDPATEEKMDVEDCLVNEASTDSDDDWNDHHSIVKNLIIEKNTDEPIPLLNGRRIVDIQHFISEITELSKHGKYCTLGSYKLVKEYKIGLFTKLKFHCDNCNKDKFITSEPPEKCHELNDAFVWGSVSVGIGFSQAEEIISIMNMPTMSPKKYRKHELRLGKVWEETLIRKMADHAAEERKIAIEKGNLLHGNPFITVIGDGGWGKRSYGHGLNSSSGVGVVIGAHTKKILFLGVKNKFCYVCSKAKTHKTEVPPHDCFKNYCGPSTGMETSVIVEAFKRSVEDYGLIYRNYIGDGDSSVYARIQEGCRYGRFVNKVECANHMTRALSDNLHKLSTNTQYSLESRRLLLGVPDGKKIPRLERLVKGVRTAIKSSGVSKSLEEIQELRKDLKNAPNHVFGDHERCREAYCQDKLTNEVNEFPNLDPEFSAEIHKLVDRVVRKADSLVMNATTNCAERYMGLVSKFIGGKRVNYSNKGSYRGRCFAAGLSHSSGPSWHLSPWKSCQGRSPGQHFKKKFMIREKTRAKRALRYSVQKPTRRTKRSAGTDKEYGPLAIEPDVEENVLKEKMDAVLATLKNEATKAVEIERQTVGQHNNKLWKEKRLNRITASTFGQVVKRLDHTPCHNLVKSILYSREINSESVIFGRLNEKNAVNKYEATKNIRVQECGLFICTDHPYLGASPDGLVDDNGLVEVKCLPSVTENLLEAAKKKKTCLEIGPNKNLQLKRKHNYYYQIQGQLNISNRQWCDVIVLTKKDELHIERLYTDKQLWLTVMLPKLEKFYFSCVLPEIADSRIVRGLKIRDPEYILLAIEKRQNSKKGSNQAVTQIE